MMLGSEKATDDAKAILERYGFERCADVYLRDDRFVIELAPKWGSIEKAIYVFVIDDKIVRIGSSKGKLSARLKGWSRDVSNAFQGNYTPTPELEAQGWRERLSKAGQGAVYARQGHEVTTPIGTFNAYLDEESILIGRYDPPLNRNKHR